MARGESLEELNERHRLRHEGKVIVDLASLQTVFNEMVKKRKVEIYLLRWRAKTAPQWASVRDMALEEAMQFAQTLGLSSEDATALAGGFAFWFLSDEGDEVPSPSEKK